ncbi:exonuclease SbcC [Gordonia sp. PKS22-38]|uniref:Exonuclease SbcC n=1 Tax=Gordonia prachuapensis TaxID=3115651 RepID=A0ABU7N0G7_9ACTN|nr:exonuclease SbcC [Gordonia sp. PKS22-38]
MTSDLRPVAAWAANCAERVLPIFETVAPTDARVRLAIEAARDFADGRPRDKALRDASFGAHRAAGAYTDTAAQSAARAASMAAAVAYTHLDLTGTAAARQTRHLLGAAAYAAQATEHAHGAQVAAEVIAQMIADADEPVRQMVGELPPSVAGDTSLGRLLRELDAALRRPSGP